MILDQCDGAEGIADDVVVYGATEDEHDKNLHQLLNVAIRNGLVFNSSKCLIKERSVSFFGLIYGIDGINPDPDRIRDLQDIPPPRDKKELQQFLGLMTFLSPFIRNLSEKDAMLRDLLKEDSMFMWELHHQSCFDGLKHLVTTRSCLQYFNVAKTAILRQMPVSLDLARRCCKRTNLVWCNLWRTHPRVYRVPKSDMLASSENC